MKSCPYCAEEIQERAVKCRYCGSSVDGSVWSQTWYRSRRGKMIAGVCTGLAEHFGVSVTALRLAFVLSTLFGGWGLILYPILWIVMPYRPERRANEVELRHSGS